MLFGTPRHPLAPGQRGGDPTATQAAGSQGLTPIWRPHPLDISTGLWLDNDMSNTEALTHLAKCVNRVAEAHNVTADVAFAAFMHELAASNADLFRRTLVALEAERQAT
jgi:hypothetical protein